MANKVGLCYFHLEFLGYVKSVLDHDMMTENFDVVENLWCKSYLSHSFT